MKTWIFQGNPKVFDIDGYLVASTGVITWFVSRYADQIGVGDCVYIWKSQADDASSAGIVAEGTVVEPATLQADDPIAEPFWLSPPDEAQLTRVKIRLNRIASKREMLKRDWMKEDSALQSMLILRQPAGSNFPVTPIEATRLGQLWRKTGHPWNRDEIVAAIWLYERLFEKPISKTEGSEVETLAQQIGRVPTGLYNKLMNLRALDPRAKQQGLKGGSKLDEATWNEFFSLSVNEMAVESLNQEFQRLWSPGVISDQPSDTNIEIEEKRLAGRSIDDLLKLYANRPKNRNPQRRSQASAVYDRDPLVVTLRKKLASYQCEVEDCTSPKFENVAGEMFVEVHHIKPLAEGGPDILENTVALCPTHHRFLHVGKDQKILTEKLWQKRNLE